MKKVLIVSALAPMFAIAMVAGTAFAYGPISVSNSNTATISNTVSSVASTGSNTANGGNGSDASVGGNAGKITTGSAGSESDVKTAVNGNITLVHASANASSISVDNTNSVSLTNSVGAGSATGYNAAGGGAGTTKSVGGNAGSVNTGDATSISHVVSISDVSFTQIN